MEPIRLLSGDEISAAYEQGKEAVIRLFHETLGKLAERIQRLEDLIAKNSGNSSKPPSSDGLTKKTRSLREPSGKKSGGQLGHKGHTLKAVAKPDQVELHRVKECKHCHASLEKVAVQGHEKRQVFEVPQVRVQVTEHQAEIKECPICRQKTVAEFPDLIRQPVQYGSGLKAQLVYFNQYQFVPLERTVEIIEALYGHTVSEAAIVEACTQAAQQVEPINQAAKEELKVTEEPVCFDETGGRIVSKLWWLHVEIKKTVEEAQPAVDHLSAQQIVDFEARYDAIVTAGLQANFLSEPAPPFPKKRGEPKQHPAKNLLDHFQTRKQGVLAFMYDFKAV